VNQMKSMRIAWIFVLAIAGCGSPKPINLMPPSPAERASRIWTQYPRVYDSCGNLVGLAVSQSDYTITLDRPIYSNFGGENGSTTVNQKATNSTKSNIVDFHPNVGCTPVGVEQLDAGTDVGQPKR